METLSPNDALTPKKVNIQTFGCQMNEYDTDKMLEVLQKENYVYTESCEEADLILLNTCSVREKAEHKVYSMLGRLRILKETNPQLVIGVGGCMAQQEGSAILKREASVDLVFGTDNLFDLPAMLADVRAGERIVQTERKAYKQKVRNFIPDFTFAQTSTSKLKAHLAITKGCNNYCSFCIVPTTRGLEVSREPENILQEARTLVENGAREVCLLGQNVNSYQANGVDFVDLIYRLAEIPGLARIRFTSPHPKDFNERLARAFAEVEPLCEQLHLPLQSGSDLVLKRMKRHYTLAHYLEKLALMRQYAPQATISTDLIVGFPGETEEDFAKTMEAISLVRFEQIYAFKYSPRPGTPASDYEGQLPEEVKIERLRLLLEHQEAILEEKYQALHGTEQEVMIEGWHPRDLGAMSGRTRGNHAITVWKAEGAEPGALRRVRVTGHKKYSLEAECL